MMARCRLGWDGIGSHSDNNREPAAEDLDWVEDPGPRMRSEMLLGWL
jgi:hypothetical protein